MPLSNENDISLALRDQVLEAGHAGTALDLMGGGTKAFYGRPATGQRLDLAHNRGVVSYEPTELVITARGGTPLQDLVDTLGAHGQMLPFEPPHYGAMATLGGTVAAGLSGPRRPYTGAVRDFVLGTRILTGHGKIVRVGGEVMKNVAGYDVSRLMAGAMGTLGILLEISLKVLPRPEHEITLARSCTPEAALEEMNRWAGRPVPLSAASYDDGVLYMRLSGMRAGVEAARLRIGGDPVDDGRRYWRALREHSHAFFGGEAPLWRLSLAPDTAPLALEGRWLIDWGGYQRWLRTDLPAATVRAAASAAGGHATLFRGGDRGGEVFQPLPPALAAIHANLKSAFDPYGILNPGRLYADW